MKNCIIVKIPNEKTNKFNTYKSKIIDELALCYNIPSIVLCINKKQSVNNLRNFIVKYYWFCNVV